MFESKLTKIIQMLNKKPRKLIRKDYKEFVLKKPCLVTGNIGPDPHHLRNLNGLTGMALTPTDEYIVPLTRTIHTEFHSMTDEDFEARYDINLVEELHKLHDEFVEHMRV